MTKRSPTSVSSLWQDAGAIYAFSVLKEGAVHQVRIDLAGGTAVESFATKTRDKAAALAFMKKARKRHGSPNAVTTDGLRSYAAAMTELGNAEKQEVGRWANNRVENSHLPFRR